MEKIRADALTKLAKDGLGEIPEEDNSDSTTAGEKQQRLQESNAKEEEKEKEKKAKDIPNKKTDWKFILFCSVKHCKNLNKLNS